MLMRTEERSPRTYTQAANIRWWTDPDWTPWARSVLTMLLRRSRNEIRSSINSSIFLHLCLLVAACDLTRAAPAAGVGPL